VNTHVKTYTPPVVLSLVALAFAAVQLLVFPPLSSYSYLQFALEGLFPVLTVTGLFLVQTLELDSEVERPFVAALFMLSLHGVTEAADELVLPAMWVNVVFEHTLLLVGTGTALFAFWRWAANRRRREMGLRRYRTAVETSPGPIYAVDTDEQFTLVNDAFCSLVGTARDELLGEPLSSLVGRETMDQAELERIRAAFESLRTGHQETVRLETTVDTRDSRRRFEHSVSYFDDEAHSGFVSVGHDITEREERRERLGVLNRLLRHNLRNALTVVSGSAGHIQEAVGSRAAVEGGVVESSAGGEASAAQLSSVPELAARIKQQSTRILDQTEKVRRFEAVQSGQTRPTSVRLDTFLETITESYQQQYPTAQFQADAPEERVLCRTDVVRPVLDELVGNATEHADGPLVQLRATVTSADRLELVVDDDGPGLPEMERRVVEERSEDPLRHSTGIGLWVARWLVERSGGSIAFDEATDGTAVRVVLPVYRTREAVATRDGAV